MLASHTAAAARECAGRPFPAIPGAGRRAESDAQPQPGSAVSIDLIGCDARSIRDAGQLRRFVTALCELLALQPLGEPIVARLGAGYSLIQRLECSLISGHFVEASGDATIDIFSREPYSPYEAAELCRAWFGAADMRINVVLRPAEG